MNEHCDGGSCVYGPEFCRVHAATDDGDGYHVCVLEPFHTSAHACACGHTWPRAGEEP